MNNLQQKNIKNSQESNHPYQICQRCVLDTTIFDIRFDNQGICNYCKIHDELEKEFPLNEEGQVKLNQIVRKIKRAGEGKKYDIIVGVSGGRDSTFGLYTTVQLGLKPLAVHFDNGWNSEIAVNNIKNATNKLDIDLYTYVIDWEEFKDLQIAFLKASVSDAEIPTDVAIHGILHRVAAKENIKYILFAHSFRTEGFAPLSWTYMDGRYIKSVHKKYANRKLITYPNFTLFDYFKFYYLKGIKTVPLLAYVNYNQKDVETLLKKELDWQYYGGHHHESYYTHFFQSYYLPKKFNIDKRKIESSALIRSGQITRHEALEEIRKKEYPYEKELVSYTVSKLGLTQQEFEEILNKRNKSFRDYSTYYPLLKLFKSFIYLASQLKLIPKYLYLRYLG